MPKVKDILKKMSIDRDENGYYGIYMSFYAEGGTRAEVENKLLDRVIFEKRHNRLKKKKTYEDTVFWGVIGLN